MRDENFACLLVHVFSDRGVDPETEAQQVKERFAQVNEWVQNDCVPAVLPSWADVTINHGGGGGP